MPWIRELGRVETQFAPENPKSRETEELDPKAEGGCYSVLIKESETVEASGDDQDEVFGPGGREVLLIEDRRLGVTS
jgi:hypothetical protein